LQPYIKLNVKLILQLVNEGPDGPKPLGAFLVRLETEPVVVALFVVLYQLCGTRRSQTREQQEIMSECKRGEHRRGVGKGRGAE